ncbi:MAG: hypothetical protein HQ514_07090 [Rhodospirillales bacterium]|nr:hypothetical protein [Rhodospirillales bacterium]
MYDLISTRNIRKEAEEMRAAVFAQAFRKVFKRLAQPFVTLQKLIDRAQTMQQVTEFDDNWLAEFSMRRADIPAYVAGQITPIRKTVATHKQKVELRDAA